MRLSLSIQIPVHWIQRAHLRFGAIRGGPRAPYRGHPRRSKAVVGAAGPPRRMNACTRSQMRPDPTVRYSCNRCPANGHHGYGSAQKIPILQSKRFVHQRKIFHAVFSVIMPTTLFLTTYAVHQFDFQSLKGAGMHNLVWSRGDLVQRLRIE